MSQPTIPPRPQRAQAGPTSVSQNTPQIPPRPVRKADPSPSREANSRSPFNEPPTSMGNGRIYGHSNLSASELPRRPPSVSSMPTVGQEGLEYASYDQLPAEAHGVSDDNTNNSAETVQQTRHADVPMLQPTASVPQSTAKSRISTVTRTDSSQAVAAGIGRSRADDDRNDSSTSLGRVTSREHHRLSRVSSREPHPLRATSSFNQSSTSLPGGHDDDEEQGIPAIGMQVPMYKNAGDVQAPSPSPYAAQFPAGIGFFNDGTARNHHRKRSSRQEFGPPGSYGRHGHPGEAPNDQFERDWMAKHPEIAAKEGYNAYGGLSPRPATALSSDQLNKLVQENIDVGMGASRDAISTPSQEIGWEASEQYTSRMNSPKAMPAQAGGLKKRSSSGQQPQISSPLRTAAIPDISLDSEDDSVIHVDGKRITRGSKVTGGGDKDNKFSLDPQSANTAESGYIDEHGSGTPILASDETMKRPGSAYMQPAVSPEAERSDFLDDGSRSRRGSAQPSSRPTSRPNSIHGFGGGLHRFISHDDYQGSGHGTPLEEIEEYEPLFPEDDDKKASMAQKLKQRPGLAQHHFPSQDIWEDTPASLQFTTSVETPEPPQEPSSATEAQPKPSAVFESPEEEQRRREQNPEGMTSDNKTFAKPHFKPGVQDEQHNRPGFQRFPSQDIWEDTPDSMRLETTVSAPQQEEIRSPEDRPTTTLFPSGDDDARSSTGFSQLMHPAIPARPKQRSKLAQDITPDIAPPPEKDEREQEVPDLGAKPPSPEKPKPAIPARPARYKQPEQPDPDSPAAKPKPAVPGKPAAGKFANLKSGFMSDLASRLQLGPQGPAPKVSEPEEEPAEEKAPLADARKSRAKGPPRRKAAAATSPAPAAASMAFSIAPAMTLWSIDERDVLSVPASQDAEKVSTDSPGPASFSSGAYGPATPLEKANPLGTPASGAAVVGSEGDIPSESLAPAGGRGVEEIQPEFEKALEGAEEAPGNAGEAAEEGMKGTEEEIVQGAGVSGYTGAKDPGSEGNVVVRDGEEVGRQGAD